MNEAENFYDNHYEDFCSLLRIPAVAHCLFDKKRVPYEYADSTRKVRYKRIPQEVDSVLFNDLGMLTIYCIKNSIKKEYLNTICGGNLYEYSRIKNSYGGGF